MKKKIFTILIVCVLLIIGLMGCNRNLSKIQISTGSDNNLNTLILTDIRFDGSGADAVRERMITKMVNDGIGSGNAKEDYEFIAIVGNMVNSENNGEVMKKAVEFIDSLGIPWAMSLGELDVKGKTSKNGIMNILTSKKLKNSLVMRGDSYQNNYCLEIVKSDKKVNNIFFFFDTSENCSDSVVSWYKNICKNKVFAYADVQGKMINSHIFLNRALPIYKDNENVNFEINAWGNSIELQKAIFELGSTVSVIAGGYDEDSNGTRFDYKKVHLAYAKSMYFNSLMTGELYDKQKNRTGCSYQKFNTSSVYLSTKSYSPDQYKDSVS